MCNSCFGGMAPLNELSDQVSTIQQMQVALARAEAYRVEIAKIATTLSVKEPDWLGALQDADAQEHLLRATLYAVTVAISEVLSRPPSSHMALLKFDSSHFGPKDGR